MDLVEDFMKKWLDDSMRRAWSAIQSNESIITEGNVCRLFQHLMAPFGNDHPFCCIPVVFTRKIGQPPREWPFIRTAVKDLFRSWSEESSMPMAKKKRKMNHSAPSIVKAEIKEEVNDHVASSTYVDEDVLRQVEPGGGHPMCTSVEDCIGSISDPLVQHMLGSEEGDVYCQTCWESFLKKNPTLRGVFYERPHIVISGSCMSDSEF